MTTTIIFSNQKGGVGKTTSAVTIAHGLAIRGYRTLIVDLDPQGHVSLALGLEKRPGLYKCIVDEANLSECITQARLNLWILPGDKTTERVKRYVTSMDYREQVLSNLLLDAVRFDFVVLDMAPSLDVLHVAGLVASDFMIIPTKLDPMAVDGVNEALKSYAEIVRRGGNIQDYRILPTFFDRVTKETAIQLRDLTANFGERVWPPIPVDTRAREAPASGSTLWEFSPQSPAVAGIQNGPGRLGGYQQVMSRLMEIVYG